MLNDIFINVKAVNVSDTHLLSFLNWPFSKCRWSIHSNCGLRTLPNKIIASEKQKQIPTKMQNVINNTISF